MAEAYGLGKLFGIMIPWIIDLGCRLIGVDIYGVEGFYIPYFYVRSDQIEANISSILFLCRKKDHGKPGLINISGTLSCLQVY